MKIFHKNYLRIHIKYSQHSDNNCIHLTIFRVYDPHG
jgi:hypothetical protein